MPLEVKNININKQKVGFFRFKELSGRYLLTNDIGEYCFLAPPEFDLFLAGKIEESCADKYSELQRKGFIRDWLDFDGLTERYAKKNMFLGQAPSLHIVVVTLRCDHRCIYCQSSSQQLDAKEYDMSIAIARNVVDRIFESPNENITIEFQGGEPLANFDTVKFIVEYVRKKNKIPRKRILISLVSNMTFMTQERLKFFVKNNVTFCTSLDGPQALNNKNRLSKGNSYKNTLRWIKNIKKEIKKNGKYKYKVNALTTIIKDSLAYPEEIIDEFVDLGLEGIHLRPVSPFGAINKKIWERIVPSAEDFLNFYKEALDYIIELNLNGKRFYERTAKIFLAKILGAEDPNFLDLRSPCGAGVGQLAYNFNGDVYTCDEARMLSVAGDESFKLGNAKKNTYQDFVNNDVVKTMCSASCLDVLPGCSECVYKPYCGVCPVYNYATEGNIFSRLSNNKKCKIQRGILDYLFKKLQNKKIKEVFLRWTKT